MDKKVTYKEFQNMTIRQRDDFFRDDPELYNKYNVRLKQDKGLLPRTLDEILKWNEKLNQ